MKKSLKYIIGILVLLASITFFSAWKIAPVGTGYTAKYLCSHVFTSGQDPEEAMELFIEPVHPLFKTVRYRVDYEHKEVSAWFLGFLRPATAVYREGCGCTLLVDDPAFELGHSLAEATAAPVKLNHAWCASFCVLGGGSCSA